jgi:hypothetical protein
MHCTSIEQIAEPVSLSVPRRVKQSPSVLRRVNQVYTVSTQPVPRRVRVKQVSTFSTASSIELEAAKQRVVIANKNLLEAELENDAAKKAVEIIESQLGQKRARQADGELKKIWWTDDAVNLKDLRGIQGRAQTRSTASIDGPIATIEIRGSEATNSVVPIWPITTTKMNKCKQLKAFIDKSCAKRDKVLHEVDDPVLGVNTFSVDKVTFTNFSATLYPESKNSLASLMALLNFLGFETKTEKEQFRFCFIPYRAFANGHRLGTHDKKPSQYQLYHLG